MAIIWKRLLDSFKCVELKRNVIFLTCAGLLPFIVLTLLLQLNWLSSFNICNLLITYAGLILSFLGGMQWGVGLMQPDKCAANFPFLFTISILPTLVAWFLLAINNIHCQLIGLAFAFSGVLIIDIILTLNRLLPSWFLKLRISITLIVIMLLILNVVNLNRV